MASYICSAKAGSLYVVRNVHVLVRFALLTDVRHCRPCSSSSPYDIHFTTSQAGTSQIHGDVKLTRERPALRTSVRVKSGNTRQSHDPAIRERCERSLCERPFRSSRVESGGS